MGLDASTKPPIVVEIAIKSSSKTFRVMPGATSRWSCNAGRYHYTKGGIYLSNGVLSV